MARHLPLLLTLALAAVAAAPEWPQYGGPHRNFVSDSTGLAPLWPTAGPKQLWKRELGEGYSQIAVDGGRLYTMYRKGNDEIFTALDAGTGKTIWERARSAPFGRMAMENGPGPHSTPVVAGNRVFTVGILAQLVAYDKSSGKELWVKDLYKDFPNSSLMDRGYSCSPLIYKDTLIVQLGGPNHAVVALKQADGSLAWRSESFTNSPSSPILIRLNGEDQLVTFLAEEITGMNPSTGALLWKHGHKTDWGLNIALPAWSESDSILVMSSAYSGGARAIQLTQSGGKTSVKELWANNQFRVHHGTMIRIGDMVVGSSGDFGPAPMKAVDVKTGKVLWQERALSKATFLSADGKLIVLEEDGALSLATVSPQGLKVLSRVQLLTSNCWTAPSMAGTKVYIRDRRSIMALDLAESPR
jgi:outer membrane protein assembly factor BamB